MRRTEGGHCIGVDRESIERDEREKPASVRAGKGGEQPRAKKMACWLRRGEMGERGQATAQPSPPFWSVEASLPRGVCGGRATRVQERRRRCGRGGSREDRRADSARVAVGWMGRRGVVWLIDHGGSF